MLRVRWRVLMNFIHMQRQLGLPMTRRNEYSCPRRAPKDNRTVVDMTCATWGVLLWGWCRQSVTCWLMNSPYFSASREIFLPIDLQARCLIVVDVSESKLGNFTTCPSSNWSRRPTLPWPNLVNLREIAFDHAGVDAGKHGQSREDRYVDVNEGAIGNCSTALR